MSMVDISERCIHNIITCIIFLWRVGQNPSTESWSFSPDFTKDMPEVGDEIRDETTCDWDMVDAGMFNINRG